jgi:hypothetical protein
MPKYKISKSNLKEFFGWFGKKNKPKDLQSLIDNDPQLKAIEKRIKDIDKKYEKDTDPRWQAAKKKYGI